MFGECALTDPGECNRPGVARGGFVTHRAGMITITREASRLIPNQRAPVSRLISAARSSGVHAETVTPPRDARR
jgi:hypothetical protein